MPLYGKNMRSCCDSLAERDTRHMRGCPNENAIQSKYFVSTHDEERPMLLTEGLYNWLTANKYDLGPWRSISEDADIGEVAMIHSCDGGEFGSVLWIDHKVQK